VATIAPFRLGIIGAERLSSRRIYPCLHYIDNLLLAAVCDIDVDRASLMAQKFGGQQVFADHRRMVAEADLDGVVVCTGPQQHETLAIEMGVFHSS